MTGRHILLDAVRGKQTPRTPWLPFVGCHGGALIDRSASAYLRSSDLIVEGLTKAIELYKPDGLPVVFDLQVEAEVLGCPLQWADDAPPSVTGHPMSLMEGEGKSLEDLPPFSLEAGRVPMVLDATRRMRERVGDDVALYGLVTGPFTLTMHLMGNDLFMAMYDEPEKVQAVGAFAAEVASNLARAYLDAGADVIAVVDPMVSQISAEHFSEFVTPHANTIFDAVHEAGGLGSMFVCGDATRNLEVMADTHCDNVSIDEQIPLDKIRDICLPKGKSFGGNMKLTVVLLMGDENDAKIETIECLDAGGDAGFVLAPGCDLPYAVPSANLQAVAELVHDPYQRDVARTLEKKLGDSFDDIELPDYQKEPAVIVDVITLNSESCAPCQYMFAAAMQARSQLDKDFKVDVREHRITTREGVGMMTKLGVGNLPSICIDGELKFASLTPDANTLANHIAERARAKGLEAV
ncbi:MAG: uroporphyrinogen decarboxylase family protein [Phycisphaeraceae bacterium]